MTGTDRPPRILAFATQGAGGDDEQRLRALLERVEGVEWFAFDRADKKRSGRELFRRIRAERPDLVVMEGTGIAGGSALLSARTLFGTRFVFSSGDAVGPFVAAIRPVLGPAFTAYEHMLYRRCSGFIGWTPYLVGRALSFGAPRAMTAPGWAPFRLDASEREAARIEARDRWGISRDALVIGIVGSLAWTPRRGYCYGWELVNAMARVRRSDVRALIVGDGTGRPHLERAIAERCAGRCVLTGRVPREEVPRLLAAFDVASLPQSLDGVGAFRYTTKISEYMAASLPIVTGELPFAYDLDGGWIRRIPGAAPWDPRYHEALAAWVDRLGAEELHALRAAVPTESSLFDRERQSRATAAFLASILNEARRDQNSRGATRS
ncbi:MAG: glycosyltransferase [Isosphaeraceae bacterium]|nr:glycosyltransferase [Isosphaeraceae bacterium]